MRKLSCCFLGFFLLVGPALAAGPARGKSVLDIWEVAYLKGPRGELVKAGYFRTRAEEIERDGKKYLVTSMEMDLRLKRFKDPIALRIQAGDVATPGGQVTGVFLRQQLGKQETLQMVGRVQGKQLSLKTTGTRTDQWTAPWNDKVVGLYRQQYLLRDRKVKPGDEFTYQAFYPEISLVVNNHVRVKDYEEIALPGRKVRQKLLRVEVSADKVENTPLPTLVLWLDKDRAKFVTKYEVSGLGEIWTRRATRAEALNAGVANIDFGTNQLVALDRRLPEGWRTRQAVYRITLPGDDDPAAAFARDARQTVAHVRGDTLDLQVRAGSPPPREEEGAKGPGAEFLKSCFFINCDDAKVKELARRAVGRETDPWRKALRIEKWVHDHMTIRNDEDLATADHVARTLEGDCTEHAMLAAAMCRAEGVPARTAQGLVYGEMNGPKMAFHMWTEVWVRGRWVPIDAVRGQGFVGADHIKISDHSWYNVRDSKPMLPLLRVVGKVKIRVVSAR